jgi:hypothetical protein
MLSIPPPLLGSYTPPNVRKGDRVWCRYRRAWCRVTRWTDGPVSWSRCIQFGIRGGSGLLVSRELVRAIRTESAAALKHWFGVGTKAVWNWRRAFKVGRLGATGSRLAHRAACLKGAEGIKAKDWTDEELDAKSAAAKACGTRPGPWWADTGWTPDQEALLGIGHDEEVARKIGRTAGAVTTRRVRLKIPAYSGWVTSGPAWTAEQVALLGTADDVRPQTCERRTTAGR